MPANNPRGNPQLTPFNSETASAAGKKSAAARRARADAKRQADAITNRKLDEWVDTYKREKLGEVAAATAQKLCDDILSNRIEVDARSAAPLLSALVDIARIEAGLHTTATMHATISSDPMAHIREIRARASELETKNADHSDRNNSVEMHTKNVVGTIEGNPTDSIE